MDTLEEPYMATLDVFYFFYVPHVPHIMYPKWWEFDCNMMEIDGNGLNLMENG